MSITPKQEAFAQAYVRLMSASAAYRKAYRPKGLSESALSGEASGLLKIPKVAQRVLELVKPLAEVAGLQIEDVLRRIACVAYFDIRKTYHPDGTPKAFGDLDEETALAISHRGSHGLVPHDKLEALDMAMRHHGL